MQNSSELSRRSLLVALLAAPGMTKVMADAQEASDTGSAQPILHGHGQIKPPLPVPDIALVLHDAAVTTLAQLANGHATAVQLMFTECTSTCPMGAATFQRVQKLLPDMTAKGMQLLSLSIDPEDDTPQAMSAWRRRFNAGPNWVAAAPKVADALKVQGFFKKGSDSSDHSTQVHILDRSGRLIWRTYELPTAEEVAGVLRRVR